MLLRFKCDFCKKEMKAFGALLFGPPKKSGDAHKYHLCRDCYKRVLQLLKAGPKVIEDIISLGPTWLNYTRKIKRNK